MHSQMRFPNNALWLCQNIHRVFGNEYKLLVGFSLYKLKRINVSNGRTGDGSQNEKTYPNDYERNKNKYNDSKRRNRGVSNRKDIRHEDLHLQWYLT